MQSLNYIDIFREGVPYFIADTVFANLHPTQMHTHNFHEFFLVKQGELYHWQNGSTQKLKKGDLCFVHASDFHYFQVATNGTPAVITNVAFMDEEFVRTMEYLSNQKLASKKVELENHTMQTLLYVFDSIYKTDHTETTSDLILLFRSLLSLVLVNFFSNSDHQQENIVPRWLSESFELMEKAENFRQGIPRFIELTGKTQEHLTRSLKKYRNQTPSEYINNLRVVEAAKQLRISSKPVNEIGFDVGFENPSYFNRLFKQAYGQSPNQYRKANHSIVYVSE
jgi:AraC family cel operon transcriptional repressor